MDTKSKLKDLLIKAVVGLPPSEMLKLYFNIRYGSLRKTSVLLRISKTALLGWIGDPEKYPGVNRKIIEAIGFDPNGGTR